ncbi:hypothetical protein PTTG_30233, partial [Puccinia triticina 1-1 BBBD Race 1]
PADSCHYPSAHPQPLAARLPRSPNRLPAATIKINPFQLSATLRTPGAYKFQKYPAVSGSRNQALLSGQTPFKLSPKAGSNASPLGARAHGAVQTKSVWLWLHNKPSILMCIYWQKSTGSRSVPCAITKDGPKGTSTKTSLQKTHEVQPSPVAFNATAPRVLAQGHPSPQAGPTTQARIPLGHEPAKLQSVPLERFLRVASIHRDNSET